MTTFGLIVAAGQGTRLGAGQAKAFVPLGGRPLIGWTMELWNGCPHVDGLVLVVSDGDVSRSRALFGAGTDSKVSAIVAGGATRAASVAAGLEALPKDARLVAVHDGARPFPSTALVARVLSVAAIHGAAIPVLPVTDTVKTVVDDLVVGTLDRRELVRAQTPQGFDVALLRRAHAVAGARADDATDDAALVEAIGHPVRVVHGEPDNIKLTTPEDWARAEWLLARRCGAPDAAPLPRRVPRIGQGYDFHRLVASRPLILGGVELDFDRGLLGHSDADVLSHAVIDALLGALGDGDIGTHFPSTDAALRNRSSLTMLTEIAARVRDAGYAVGNLDCTVVCERPRLSEAKPQMTAAVAAAMGIALGQVNIKAKTNEGAGPTGRGEGIACHAVALLIPAE